MPPKDQEIFDMTHIFESIDSFTENIEAHFESVSRSLKDSFRASTWLPDSIKPPPPPAPRRIPSLPATTIGYLETSRVWITEHRAVTAAVVAFVGTGAFIIWRSRRSDRAKRRARRAKNGSRTEIIVLAGSPHSPLTRSLSLDLERRGFIVYIPVNSLSEEQLIQAESRADIRPLSLDITSPASTENTIQKLTIHLNTPQQPIPHIVPHTLHLTSLILLPSPTYPSAPITALTPSTWSDSLNTHLLAPFTTLHAFLPLLTAQKASLLILTPSITSSLCTPSKAPESVVAGAMSQYTYTLRKEVGRQGINVVHFRLGLFDYGNLAPERQQLVPSNQASRVELTKQRLEQNGLIRHKAQGSPMRELHNAVFDAVVRGKGSGGTIFVGQGARVYDFVGKFLPQSLLAWMMERKEVVKEEVEESDGMEKAKARSKADAAAASRKGSGSEGSAEWEAVENAV